MLGWLLIALAYIYGGSLPLSSPDIVTIQVIDSIVYSGKSNKVEIEVNVKDGYHIQANEVNDESLIPTTLEITSNEYLITRKQEFPRSKKFKLEGTDRFLNVYDGKFLIKLFIDPPKTAAESKYFLEARLRYQACDSKSCLFPRTINFSIPLEIKNKK
jgi:uncharacterized protein